MILRTVKARCLNRLLSSTLIRLAKWEGTTTTSTRRQTGQEPEHLDNRSSPFIPLSPYSCDLSPPLIISRHLSSTSHKDPRTPLQGHARTRQSGARARSNLSSLLYLSPVTKGKREKQKVYQRTRHRETRNTGGRTTTRPF